MFHLETPGGGGYGEPTGEGDKYKESEDRHSHTFMQRGSVFEYKLSQESA